MYKYVYEGSVIALQAKAVMDLYVGCSVFIGRRRDRRI
jgi:hypothetical protein